jgi:hypothetical protein
MLDLEFLRAKKFLRMIPREPRGWSQRAHQQLGPLVLSCTRAGYSAAFLVLAGIAASGFLRHARNTRPRRTETGPNRNGGPNPMSPASLDLRTLATVAIFVATYAGVALGRMPGLRINRAGISLIGASLMIAFGTSRKPSKPSISTPSARRVAPARSHQDRKHRPVPWHRGR